MGKVRGTIQVVDKSGTVRMPRERPLGFRARCRGVYLREAREPAEVCVGVAFRDAYDRHVEMPSDHFGDLAERYAFFGNAVIHGVLGGAFERETVEARCIAAMHSGPPILSIADIRGNAALAGDPDEDRYEAVVFARTMNRG